MTAKPPLAVNTSFKIDTEADKIDIVEVIGNPTTGATDVSIWLADAVIVALRQTNVGTMKVLKRYALNHLNELPATGPTILHAIAGGTETDVGVDGVPTSDQIRLEIGADIITGQNSGKLTESTDQLIDAFLEASTGN